jgi:hypothetical protein
MITDIIWYHTATINLFLILIFSGISLSIFFYGNIVKFIKYTRIYFFTYYALLVMIGFDGLIAMILSKRELSINMILMIGAFFILIGLEIYKFLQFKRFVHSPNNILDNYRKIAVIVAVIQILITVSFVWIYLK